MEVYEMSKQKERKKMSEEEKQQRKDMLKQESIDDRTKRVINPRLNRIIDDLDLIINSVNSPRYKFTAEQGEKIVSVLSGKMALLENSFQKKTKTEDKEEDIL